VSNARSDSVWVSGTAAERSNPIRLMAPSQPNREAEPLHARPMVLVQRC